MPKILRALKVDNIEVARVKESLLSVKRQRCWKDYFETIMNEQNYCNYNVEGDTQQGSVESVGTNNVIQVLRQSKDKIPHRLLDVSLELIACNRKVRIKVMVELCKQVKDTYGILAKLAITVMVPL